MTRRQFISGSLASAVLLARGDTTASVDGFAFPDWAVRQIDDGVRRYFDWKGADETVAFPLITDVHSKVFGLPDPNDWRDPKRHVYFMRHIAERVGADFIADLGDHDFQVVAFGKQLPMDQVGQLVDAYHSLYRKEPKPVLFCRGNHDHAKGRIPDADYGARFNRGLNAGKGVRLTLSDDGTFGYLDLPQKRFRTIFLNTSRGFRNGLPAEELQFMADALSGAPADWQVVVLSHIPIPPILNRSRRGGLERGDENMGVAYGIIEDFANRRGAFNEGWGKCEPNCYTLRGKEKVRWCFADSRASFAGGFFGHCHCEEALDFARTHWTIRPGYGTKPANDPCGEKRDPKRCHGANGVLPKDTMMLDLVAVKPAKRQVHVFRFGWGGPESEREYAY